MFVTHTLKGAFGFLIAFLVSLGMDPLLNFGTIDNWGMFL